MSSVQSRLEDTVAEIENVLTDESMGNIWWKSESPFYIFHINLLYSRSTCQKNKYPQEMKAVQWHMKPLNLTLGYEITCMFCIVQSIEHTPLPLELANFWFSPHLGFEWGSNDLIVWHLNIFKMLSEWMDRILMGLWHSKKCSHRFTSVSFTISV